MRTYYKIKSFNIVQERYRSKFNFNTFTNRSQIFKLVKNIEAHDTWENSKAASSSQSRLQITLDGCAHLINNFAYTIQQCLQLNGRYLEHILKGISWYFWFIFETKCLQILMLSFYLSIILIFITLLSGLLWSVPGNLFTKLWNTLSFIKNPWYNSLDFTNRAILRITYVANISNQPTYSQA